MMRIYDLENGKRGGEAKGGDAWHLAGGSHHINNMIYSVVAHGDRHSRITTELLGHGL